MLTEESPHKAKKVMGQLGRLLQFAYKQGIIPENPAREMELIKSPPRHVVWAPKQIEAFVAAARAMGHESIALAALLASNLGQREGDVLALTWHAYDGHLIRLKQRKRGAEVSIPLLPEVKALLDATPRRAVHIVVAETTGRPYAEPTFQRWFAKVRNAANLARFMHRGP